MKKRNIVGAVVVGCGVGAGSLLGAGSAGAATGEEVQLHPTLRSATMGDVRSVDIGKVLGGTESAGAWTVINDGTKFSPAPVSCGSIGDGDAGANQIAHSVVIVC